MSLDASADPVDLARRLQRAHAEGVEHGGRVPADVRPVVRDSWRRTRATGLRPDEQDPVVAIEEARIDEVRRDHPLAVTRAAIHQAVGRIAQDAGHLLVVTDAGGTLLWAEGHRAVKDAAVQLGFFEGARWSEAAVGTNAIGTALAIDHPVQIFSGEHFVRTHHPWVCSGAPIHDPETGEILGVVDLSGPLRTAHPMILGFVATAARMAEHLLAERMHRDDRSLHEALLAALERHGHAPAAAVTPSGRVVASWPRGWLPGRVAP
ncbi:GAF domain-containing protein, partial [Patulibacter sp. S7RM1-6]